MENPAWEPDFVGGPMLCEQLRLSNTINRLHLPATIHDPDYVPTVMKPSISKTKDQRIPQCHGETDEGKPKMSHNKCCSPDSVGSLGFSTSNGSAKTFQDRMRFYQHMHLMGNSDDS
jgi:hypothetical protein